MTAPLPPEWAEDRAGRSASFPATWRNTLSNVAYPLAGVAVLWWVRTPAAVAMAVALLLLGIGSACYHGTAAAWGQQADRVGMHVTFGALAVHGLAPEGTWLVAGLMLGVGAFGGWIAVVRRYRDLTRAMGTYLAFALVGALLLGSWLLAAASVATFAIAFAAWWTDHRHARPLTGLWGHALWHVLTATATAALFVAQGAV